MFRLYRKTIFPRWHVNRTNSTEKKKQNFTYPKALVLCSASQKQNYSNQSHQKKQHADKQDKRCWDDPHFHFNSFQTSVLETAGWLGTAALYISYHLKYINNIFEYDRNNSACIFSNIVLAMPKYISEDKKSLGSIPDSLCPNVQNPIKDKITSDSDILGNIRSLTQQYAAAVQNSVGIQNIDKKEKKAFRSFQNAARLGSIQGLYNLGLCYHLGKGTKVNLNRAAYCYRKAAMKGHGLASFNLAIFFYKGIGGLPIDTKIAKELLAEAAEKGVLEAQLYFGIEFLEEKRWQDAVRIFTSLAKKNVPDAQYYLGLCYESGLGVGKNEKTAAELFIKSAAQGNKRAIHKLQNYHERNGVKSPFIKSVAFKSIERSNLHVSVSVPELGTVIKESNRSTTNIPVLPYLDLITPFFIIKNIESKSKDNFFTESKTVKQCASTFLPFNIPLVMDVKT